MSNLTATPPLTVTELETLAVLLDSGTRSMLTARDDKNEDVWSYAQSSDMWPDVFGGFADLKWQAFTTDPRVSAIYITQRPDCA
jgi:hypothetical protein